MAQIKDLKRMCASYEHGECESCPFYGGCSSVPDNFSDNADEIVDKWVKEHPSKTYAQDFFEKFPNALKFEHDRPSFCRGFIYGNEPECPDGGCKECWNQEMKGE